MRKSIIAITAVAALVTGPLFASDYLDDGSTNLLPFGTELMADNGLDASQPAVVANCRVADMPVVGDAHYFDPETKTVVTDKYGATYPQDWLRRGYYINANGDVDTCYAPRLPDGSMNATRFYNKKTIANAVPDDKRSPDELVAMLNAAVFREQLSPG